MHWPCAARADAAISCRYVGASQAGMTGGLRVRTYPAQDHEGRQSAWGQPRQAGMAYGVSAGAMSGFSEAELVAMQALASLCNDTPALAVPLSR